MTSADVSPDRLAFQADGLIPVIAQQYDSREVLMLAWMDAEAVRRTLATGAATYFSRSRQRYWVKGETSGHRQRVIELRYDCDQDCLLLLVDQTGPACHTGTRTCFTDRVLQAAPADPAE
jgi:phosphoribosyl-AMP cyclohydrolase